ncbi:hypothetical protein BJX99DRAFT_234003 [Aspergillus californicus]
MIGRREMETMRRPLDIFRTMTADLPWSVEDDRLLRELKASKVSWRRISAVMDGRSIGELKKRWIDIRDYKPRLREVYESREVDYDDWYYDEEHGREERHVSFSSSSDEETDEDDDSDSFDPPRQSKVKKVYYVDDEFTVDEVLLLHQVAADWKKDRWETISSQFNDRTGHSITAEQARSVVEN